VIYRRPNHGSSQLREDPSLARVPEPLPTSQTAQAAGQKFALYGVEFQVPWGSTLRVDRIKVLHENSRGQEPERLFGSEAMRSNYALVNEILRVTPQDISLRIPRIQLVSTSTPLMKTIANTTCW